MAADPTRLYLSPPHLSGDELPLVLEALESNWVAPAGPQITAFEHEVASTVGVGHAVALSSGTAALHVALVLLDIGPGDEVICSDLTFAAAAFAIRYVGATPVFIDCDPMTWQMDSSLLAEELEAAERRGKLPKAVVAVDVYGQCADYGAILPICAHHHIPVIEDAAEALGASHGQKPAGSLGRFGVLSFNGNKIITTSGGGMLVSDDAHAIARGRVLAAQSREDTAHYEHSSIGYNYGLSNVLAAIGRGQLRHLSERVAARRRNFERYRSLLGDLGGLAFMPEAGYGRSNRWLTCVTLDPGELGVDREAVRLALEAENIEARPVLKPMHLQPVFAGSRVRGGSAGARLFERGLCLPSGSSLTDADVERVSSAVRKAIGERARSPAGGR